MLSLLLQAVLPLMAVSGGTLGACTSSHDCALNGDCVNQTCTCDPPWRGSAGCDVLAFAAPISREHSGYNNASASSWGGNVVGPDASGTFHLFAAQMLKSCGLDDYGTNSAIVRATGISADGPFAFKQIILRPFAHNPQIKRVPDAAGGGWVIFFIGSGDAKASTVKDCTTANTATTTTSLTTTTMSRSSTHSAERSRRRAVVGGEIHAIWSPSLLGPWSTPVPIEFNDTIPRGHNTSRWTGGGYNPSPLIAADGTTHLAVHRTFAATPGKELLGVAVATSWRGPFTMLTAIPIKPEAGLNVLCVAGTGEDPFLYRGARQHLHIVYHGMCPSGFLEAHHAFSADNGATWTVSPRQTYSYDVGFADSSSTLFARVERPQILLDARGVPLALYNGVCDATTHGIEHVLRDTLRCWNLKQKGAGPVVSWTLARALDQGGGGGGGVGNFI